MGRPSEFYQDIADAICTRMSEGESLRQICRDESMPSISTVMRWAAANTGFQEQYARAREALQEFWAEEILDIADDGSNDWMERKNSNGESIGWQVNGEHVTRSRLRVDTRKWLLSKLAPKKYGERLHTELSGPNGGPIETKRHTDEMTDADLAVIASRGRAAPAEPPEGED